MEPFTKIFDVLKNYQEKIEKKIQESIPSLGVKSQLRDACEYALLNGGKRFRPALVYMMAKSLGSFVDVSDAALAVEYFHTASLIADDLPCMDDDDMRRNHPSVHKTYGETIALLATYALIAAGYENLAKNASQIRNSTHPVSSRSDLVCVLALENATRNTGIHGATGGQFLDIFPSQMTPEVVREIICKKTVSLFEISFVLGWLYGGGNFEQLEAVKKAAYHFGMAFQIADDLGDIVQDQQNRRVINIANVMGEKQAINIFQEELQSFQKIIQSLIIDSTELEMIANLLNKQVMDH